MSFDLRTILSPQNLLGLVTTVKGGVPDTLPPGLFTNNRPCIGNRGSYRRVVNTRTLAPVTQYGGPPVVVSGQSVSEVSEVLMHSKIAKPYDANFYSNLQGLSTIAAQRYAEDVVTYETAELKRKVMNTVQASKYQALTQGAIYLDANGLPTSSGSAVQTIDFKVPAANIDTIATLSGVTGVWSDPATDISAQLRAMKRKSAQDTGYTSMHVLYGESIPQWIRANTSIASMVAGNYVLATEQYKSTEIPAKLGDYDWHPQYTSFYDTAAGAHTQLWPTNLAVFIPSPSPDWQEMLMGTTRIPTDLGSVGQDALQMMQNGTNDASGMFSYATIDRHGIIEQCVGSTWLPVLRVPQCCYIATVG